MIWKRVTSILICAALVLGLTSCRDTTSGSSQSINIQNRDRNEIIITLNGDTANIEGRPISEYDYTWHCDPTVSHDEVENAPAEYHTGEQAPESENIYIDHDLCYYPELDQEDFRLVNYDGEQEWAYYYQDGEHNDLIFATLPYLNRSFPSDMMHSEEEASENKVLHIRKAGTYMLNGKWNGQIKIDLGEEASTDPSQRVRICLLGCDIQCTVAPAVIFENVYECDNQWEERESYDANVDLSEAGAVVIVCSSTSNTISGTNVYRMLKTKYKDEDSTDQIKLQKKMRKIDGALYSYMSMRIYGGMDDGAGELTVTSGFEGIDSELHLAFEGGKITVNSQDDGINVNEDHVSVAVILGGELTINAAQGAEGDGIDSNGFVRIDGGIVNVNGIRVPDNAIDSEDGILYNGGTINIDGEEEICEAGQTYHEIGGMQMGGPAGPFDPNGENGAPEGIPEPPEGMPDDMPEPPDGSAFPDGRPEPPEGSFDEGQPIPTTEP